MDNSITMTTDSKPWTLSAVNQVDASGNPLTTPDPDYGAPSIVVADPTIITLAQVPFNRPTIAPTGKTGSTTVTTSSTSSVSTDPVITGVTTVVVTGEVPAGLQNVFTAPVS